MQSCNPVSYVVLPAVLGPTERQYLSYRTDHDGRTGSCSGNEHRSLLNADYKYTVVVHLTTIVVDACHPEQSTLGLREVEEELRTYQLHKS